MTSTVILYFNIGTTFCQHDILLVYFFFFIVTDFIYLADNFRDNTQFFGSILIKMTIKTTHIRWAFDLVNWRPTLNDLEIAVACIQSEEKDRLSKFVFRDDFNASLIGRLLMRRFVKECLPELDYNSIKFERDTRGKPYLIDTENIKHRIDFNVSHHERYAVLAGTCTPNAINDISRNNIGVDVMSVEYTGGKQLNEFFRIMHRTFTTNEWNFIKSRSCARLQTEAFMRNWCLKESYVKNIGVGITINLQSIDFQVNTIDLETDKIVRDTIVLVDDSPEQNWIFEESLIDEKHCVSVALNNLTPDYYDIPLNNFRFKIIDFTALMDTSKPLLEIDTDYCQKILAKEYKKNT